MFTNVWRLFWGMRAPVRALLSVYWTYSFAGSLVGVFVQIFLYQKFSSIPLNIAATVFFYTGIMVGFCIPGYLASVFRFNVKHGFLAGFVVMAGALVYLHGVRDTASAFGAMFLWGLGQGVFWLTVNTFELSQTKDHERDLYSTLLNAGNQVLNLLGPACATVLLWLALVLRLPTFSLLFLVAPAVFLLGFFSFSTLADYRPPKLLWADLAHFFADRRNQAAQVYIIGTGFQQTFGTTIEPLVVLFILGTALKVGIFDTCFAIFSALCLLAVARYRTPENRLALYALSLCGIVAATAWLALRLDVAALLLFTAVVGVFGPFKNVSTHVIDLHVMEIGRKETDFYATMLLRDFFLWVWRVSGALILLVLAGVVASPREMLSIGLCFSAATLLVMFVGAWLVLRLRH